MSIELEELRTLPIADKLGLSSNSGKILQTPASRYPLPPWHREEAQRRAEELDRNPEIALTREEVWKQVATGMANRLRFHPAVPSDLCEAIGYYNEISPSPFLPSQRTDRPLPAAAVT